MQKKYIGETKRSLRERFTEHRQATNNSDHASASAAVPTASTDEMNANFGRFIYCNFFSNQYHISFTIITLLLFLLLFIYRHFQPIALCHTFVYLFVLYI